MEKNKDVYKYLFSEESYLLYDSIMKNIKEFYEEEFTEKSFLLNGRHTLLINDCLLKFLEISNYLYSSCYPYKELQVQLNKIVKIRDRYLTNISFTEVNEKGDLITK